MSSAAFQPSSGDQALSVELEQLLEEDGQPLDLMFGSLKQSVALAGHRVGDLRDRGLAVEHDPVPWNWYHGAITGQFRGGAGKRLQRTLAETAELVIPIDEVAADRFKSIAEARRAAIQG